MSLAIVIIIAAFFGITRSIHRVARSTEAVEQSYKLISDAEKLLSLIQDVETGQRGYLLTGDDNFLEPYNRALDAVGRQQRQLTNIATDTPQRQQLVRLDHFIREKLLLTRRTVGLAQRGDIDAARRIVASGVGKRSMDRIRADLALLIQRESDLLNDRRRAARRTERQALLQAILAALITLATGGFAVASVRRTSAELSRRSEESAEARRRFQATFEQAAVGIAHLAPDGTILRANDQLCAITGYARSQLVGHWFETITHPDDVPSELAKRRELLNGKSERYSLETRCLRPDGTAKWIATTVAIVRNDAGEPEFFVTVVKDIADRKQAEARLISGEAQYRAIFDTAVEAMAVIDARGVIQSVNPAAERIFGYPAEELIGRNISVLMPAATAKAHDGYLDHYRETGRRAIIGIGREVEGLRKDGSVFPLDLSVAEWRSDGETFFTGIMRDITARKRAEMNLAEAEARFRLTQEAVRAGNWETDLSNYQSTLSQESMRLFGFSGHEDGVFARGEWSALVDPIDAARARGRLERAVRDGTRFETVVRLPLADGTSRWIQMIGQAQYDATGKPVRITGLNIDVTDRRQTELALHDSEEKLRSLQNEFAHLARVNELGELAAAIAHEVNQPLTAITNYMNVGRFALATLADVHHNPTLAEVREVTELAAEQAVRAGEIVRRLRAFVSKGSGSRHAEKLEEIVDTAMALSLVDAELAGIIVERYRGAGEALVEVEAVQIQQVMVNLLRNAIDALIQVPPTEVRQLMIATKLNDGGRFAEVLVRDTGPGIAPEVRARLFEPFVTSKPTGMGMGLSLSRRIIEAHGGTIDVQSVAGQGASFRFRLPIIQAGGDT